jgi:hypothetical protein
MQDPITLISPNYGPEKLRDPSFEDLVDVFEDRVRFWLLEPAKTLLAEQEGQVAALCLLLTYFEGICIYMKGEDSRNQSKAFFRDAFRSVFRRCELAPEALANIADVLYEDARCGFFHDGLFRGRVFFGNSTGSCLSVTLPTANGAPDSTGEIKSIVVDVQEFYKYIEEHFVTLVSSLRDGAPPEAKSRFQMMCSEKWGYKRAPTIVAL